MTATIVTVQIPLWTIRTKVVPEYCRYDGSSSDSSMDDKDQ